MWTELMKSWIFLVCVFMLFGCQGVSKLLADATKLFCDISFNKARELLWFVSESQQFNFIVQLFRQVQIAVVQGDLPANFRLTT